MTNLISWTAADICKAVSGTLICGDENQRVTGISIDSRTILPENLFIAIKGDTHDGAAFIEDVIKKGVCGIVINSSAGSLFLKNRYSVTFIGVDDTRKALGDLAGVCRRRANIRVVAITGSNGKTSTRAMTTAVVSTGFSTLSTRGNFNNDIGLPLTLLSIEPHHQLAVVELGMNHPGEITRLGRIAFPDIGVITNIAPAHLEGVGSIDGVMNAKAELLDTLKPQGIAVLNADDARVASLAERTSNPKLFFGTNSNAFKGKEIDFIQAENIRETSEGTAFTIALPNGRINVNLKCFRFMIANALAAASVGYLVGLKPEQIAAGLENFTPVQGRMNIRLTDAGVHIIDDTYNANPGSMAAALGTLKNLKGSARGIFVAGDMFELGDHTASLHRQVGAAAAESGISKLYAVGDNAKILADGAIENGMRAQDIFIGTHTEIIEHLKQTLQSGDWLLIKGSRAMRMEKIVYALSSSVSAS